MYLSKEQLDTAVKRIVDELGKAVFQPPTVREIAARIQAEGGYSSLPIQQVHDAMERLDIPRRQWSRSK